ncbi:MAG TPA: hypothetical protein VIH91_01595 [Terriglobales bacterium]
MQFRQSRPRNPAYRVLLIVVSAVCSVMAVAWFACAREQAADPPSSVSVCASTIDVHFFGETNAATHNDLVGWVQRAGDAVCTYYGKFPVSHLGLDVRVRGGPGVHGGVTYPTSGGYISISLGPETTTAQLNDDWMLTHEMIHLAFPSMSRKHHWIEEGISVYVEPIARVQAGQLSAERMWHDVVRDMPQGEPEAGDEGLDRTPTWGRTYWGGAMFCLVADVRIRQQTHNRKGLQDALRGILTAGGNITQDWDIEHAFAMGDKSTGTTVLTGLYGEMRDKPDPVDLAAMWKQLGIQRRKDGSIQFDPTAPEADIRDAIIKPKPNSQSVQP